MVGLLDIAPAPVAVSIGEHRVDIYGISWTGVADIIRRYPDIAGQLHARYQRGGDIEYVELVGLLGSALGSFIAAGCGYPGDTAQERAASLLSMEAQLNLVAAIIERTMPDGIGPFVGRISAAIGRLTQSLSESEKASEPRPVKVRNMIRGMPPRVASSR